ncbi:helix-turn-helix transcriptional regulator [Kitasatospora griseola]|uniref:helix-turn-helix transcriptional regulator n=1 Tax=Kitasatospora griseola TaxID=2064 RepID=UPI00167036BA|nr:YafY family protein [Kitasatospora griseola]GGQ54916.1 DNA-binding transcriptional regulator [Kitasatospora griseola]
MRETSSRLLRLLSLLQTRREWTGAELAERLDVTTRTLRRDVDRLRVLGYPVNARIGVGGGYQLGAGAEMPPLLLDDEEVLAVALGLQSGATGPVIGIAEPALRALTKLRQVMPSRLQRRLDALQVDVLDRPQAAAVDAAVLSELATACHHRERVRFDYRSRGGAESRREVDPYRLVRVDARWYLVAWDPDRADWRSFRIDRMELKSPTGPRFDPRPLPEGGARAFVSSGLRQAFTQASARVRLHAPLERMAERIPAGWGRLAADGPDACIARLYGESPAAIAEWLGSFGAPFTVLEPPELRDACREFAEKHARLAACYQQA